MLFCAGCTNKQENNKVAIYPLSPYKAYRTSPNNRKDTGALWLSFVVYHLDKTKLSDSIYLKQMLSPFIDSLQQHIYHKQKDLQIEFYKQSKNTDTTYREEKYNLLFEHRGDMIAEYFFPYDTDSTALWMFFEEGKKIGGSIKIKDEPLIHTE
jgi:hypothetical protein